MKLQNKSQSISFKKNDTKKMLKSQSPFAVKEAYNSIRTNIMFTNMGQKCPAYVLTSSMPNEGKTINCINLAVAFAQMGKKTLIIDADMRNPTVHRYFNTSLGNGLSEILADLESSIKYEPTPYPLLMFLNAGKIPPNPAELLAGNKLDKLITHAQERFDYIFIDSPPVCIVTDASVIAKKITGYIIIARDGRSDLFAVRRAVGVLENVGGNIAGFILNSVNPKKQSMYKAFERRYRYYDFATAAE
jgi:capsular exopolysaccharide synthesis family protein